MLTDGGRDHASVPRMIQQWAVAGLLTLLSGLPAASAAPAAARHLLRGLRLAAGRGNTSFAGCHAASAGSAEPVKCRLYVCLREVPLPMSAIC